MRRSAGFAVLAGAMLVASAAVAAHMPYLKPTTFTPRRDFVTFDSAMSADMFFLPDFPIRGEGDYWVTAPSGETAKATSATVHKEFAVGEAALPTPGTYRLSTGERPGRSSKFAKIDGKWEMLRPAGSQGGRGVDESTIPAGTETMTSVGYIRAEAYVTRGAPDRTALKPTGKGLELEPITHPSEIFAGEAFKFRMLNEGQPAADAAFAIYRAGDQHAEKRYTYASKTDTSGAASVTFDQAGVYVLIASYPPRTPGQPMEPVAKSSSYSLTFEVTR